PSTTLSCIVPLSPVICLLILVLVLIDAGLCVFRLGPLPHFQPRAQRMRTMPLLQESVIRSRGQLLGSSTSLRYFLSPASADSVSTSSWTSSLTSSAPTPGISATIST